MLGLGEEREGGAKKKESTSGTFVQSDRVAENRVGMISRDW